MPRAATKVLIKILVVFAVGATLAACEDGGTADGPDLGAGGGAAASCVPAIKFEDRIYVGVQVAELPVGGEAGQAVTPPCNDTPGDGVDEQPSAPFPVLAIDGIDPAVAVATEAEAAGGYWVWFTGDEPYSFKLPAAVQKLIDAAP